MIAYYQPEFEEYVPFKGAYTTMQAVENTVYNDVITPDFSSLYPNAIRSMNACLITYNT